MFGCCVLFVVRCLSLGACCGLYLVRRLMVVDSWLAVRAVCLAVVHVCLFFVV